MIMLPKDQKTYPNLASFVSTALPLVKSNPPVWRAFKKFAIIDHSDKRHERERSIAWGHSPTLYIEDLDSYYLFQRKGLAHVRNVQERLPESNLPR